MKRELVSDRDKDHRTIFYKGFYGPTQTYDDMNLREKVHHGVLRIVIDLDSHYLLQSCASSEVWTDSGWKPVIWLHAEELHAPASHLTSRRPPLPLDQVESKLLHHTSIVLGNLFPEEEGK